ncbi:substrate-binding periplasmic protein, partial [Roseateles sp. GG27B]
LDIPIKTRYVGPWARVQEEVRGGRVDLIAGAFWTVARTDYMDYFYPPFHDTRSVVWVRQGSKLNDAHWRDLVGLQGVTVINNSFGEAFDNYARKSLKISQVASLEQAFKMLQRERADYLIYEDKPGQAYLAKIGSGSAVKMLDTAVANESLHLTLSYKSACNSGEMRGRISQALHKLATPKLMAELLTRNIELWRTQSLPP